MAGLGGGKEGHEYTIGGVKVHFPCKAYPSQVAMMAKIIGSLQKGQNGLLESPTGSGKSLALLCAALAWQKKEKSKMEDYNRAVENGLIEPETVKAEEDNDDDLNEYFDTGAGFFIREEGGDADTAATAVRPTGPAERKIKRKKAPKIYFGTRTHRQITQLIRELKKTVYKDVKMTILGSREHTCIHPTVSKMKNKTEGCRELTDRKAAMAAGYPGGGGCLYQANVKTKLANHHSLASHRGTREAWDLEDLVKVGRKVKACPYFGTRELKGQSDIVFCPYNYLVEPLIRKSMEINLKGHVIILDEAHNIEDSARDAASWETTLDEVLDARQNLETVVGAKAALNPPAFEEMISLCSKFCRWMESGAKNLNEYRDFNSQSKVWTGKEVIGEFNYFEFGPSKYLDLIRAFNAIKEESTANDDSDGFQPGVPMVTSRSLTALEGFLTVLNYLYVEDMKNIEDYRVALIRTQTKNKKPSVNSSLTGWLSKSSGNTTNLGTMLKANFWCLNPAVCFRDIQQDVRSIVLTSGTLSPMVSFSSELDVKFPIQLEANHVIDKKQLWISTVSHGPTGYCLNATYRNTESFEFQDEMGRLVCSVCKTVGRGILLFLPSYSMLKKLSDRWQMTGLWEEIEKKKVILSEPRFSDEFESTMRHFYDTIEATKDGDEVNGCLFLAVFRGKVSEGLDFADDNARAVICLGIPFPNIKDVQVDLKKRYNDGVRRSRNANLLTGKDWYEIQAFRALNQALGRCIRHRDDWGAIIMVDDRYSRNPRYMNSLSKWVRTHVRHFPRSDGTFFNLLTSFNEEMVAMDQDRVKLAAQEMQELDLKPSESESSKGGWVSKESTTSEHKETKSISKNEVKPLRSKSQIVPPSKRFKFSPVKKTSSQYKGPIVYENDSDDDFK